MSRNVSELKKQQILELYICSNIKKLSFISEIASSSDNTVSKIIQDCFDRKLEFERGDFKIFHSKINGYD